MARHITVEGMSFGYVDIGSGPPVILIHGSMSDYSRRFHWPNSVAVKDADATVQRQVEDLAEIIRALGLASTDVVGHSYGATVVLFFALQHPD